MCTFHDFVKKDNECRRGRQRVGKRRNGKDGKIALSLCRLRDLSSARRSIEGDRKEF